MVVFSNNMQTGGPSTKVSSQVKVQAQTIFLDEYSNAEKSHYLFCYKITITNNNPSKVKLLNRHWIIIDSNSKKTEVKGSGVVGQQPELAPEESYQYYSFCNLETNFGTMEGYYEMLDDNQSNFLVEIPRFFLAENLNEFPKPHFKRGSIVRHKRDGFRAIVTDYDMYFINDEEIYNKDPGKPAKDEPWYYVLIDKTNAINYVAQEYFELDENQEDLEHPLVDFFFDGFNGQRYIRNEKTWEQLKRA